jgi:tetratricopeptide (TPR) repeat protein
MRFVAALALSAAFFFGPADLRTHGPADQQADVQFQEARRLFDALDYEKAVAALDAAIAALEASSPKDAARRDKLASAYEMRARSKFGLGDQDGAKADFVQLLKVNPSHTLSGQVSPRVVALFEETVKETVTSIAISVTPATATLELDGMPLASPGTVRVAVGEHVVSAEQQGFRPAKQTITAVLGSTAEVALTLERSSSVLRIITSPADVEVRIDGASVGKTTAAQAEAGSPPATVSAPLIVSDVANGSHVVELRRDCYVTSTMKVAVEKPDDYPVGPVTLQPAVATLTVSANQPGAQVFVDGQDRGAAPYKTADLCAGEHILEVRTRFGRDVRRVEAKTGANIVFEGVIKPTFAIVSASGAAATAAQDIRVLVERAMANSQSVRLVAPPADQADKALKGNQLSSDWLATDAGGRPVGAAAQMAAPIRKEASTRLSETFGAQGVASVTALDANKVVVALLAAGSTTPDVLEISLDNTASIGAAVSKLDQPIPLARPSLGVLAIDVADVPGAVVAGVDASSPAAATPLRVGDVITQAGGQPVGDAMALSKAVGSAKAGQNLAIDARDAAGAPKRVELPVYLTPRVIGISEQGIPANRVLLDLRARAAELTDPFEQSVVRLNTAVALGRIGEWAAAQVELRQVKLPDRPGVGSGTVQYLLGVAAEALGNRAEAEAAYKAAAATDSLLTDDGPRVKDLAEARLAELQRAAR